MVDYRIQRDRDRLRRELRRELREKIGPAHAMDTEDLLDRVSDPYPSTYGALLRERCVLRQLREMGIPDEAVARAFHLCVDEMRRRRDEGFYNRQPEAREIDLRVLDEIPDAPEPGRYVDALDGQGGRSNALPTVMHPWAEMTAPPESMPRES